LAKCSHKNGFLRKAATIIATLDEITYRWYFCNVVRVGGEGVFIFGLIEYSVLAGGFIRYLDLCLHYTIPPCIPIPSC
jgi:hypothetical protein